MCRELAKIRATLVSARNAAARATRLNLASAITRVIDSIDDETR